MAIFPPATSGTSPMSGIYASLRQAQSPGSSSIANEKMDKHFRDMSFRNPVATQGHKHRSRLRKEPQAQHERRKDLKGYAVKK